MRVRTIVGTTALAQMMPPGAIKGGTAMKFRLGAATRFTRDLDVARSDDAQTFRRELELSLNEGWSGFSGRVAESRSQPRPPGVPVDYLMKPFDIKLEFRGRSFMTVPLEVGHDEIGDTADTVTHLSPDLVVLFETLGLDTPQPVQVLALHHQIAQKLHACTAPGSDRAHDLVDLQLLCATEELDLPLTRRTAERLFDSRHAHAWPPVVRAETGWKDLYSEAAEDLSVEQELPAAIDWTNDLIRRVVDA